MNHKHPLPTPILHQAAIHTQPKLLLRPRATPAPAAAPENVQAQLTTQLPAQADVPAASVAAMDVALPEAQQAPMEFSLAELRERAHREGFIAGLSEGRESGLQAGREEGLSQGYQDGLKQGQEQAEQTAQREIEAVRQALQAKEAQLLQLLSSIPEAFSRRFAASEDDMVALVQEALLRILGQGFASGEAVRMVLDQAVQDMSSRLSISIRVHPDDFALLQNSAEDSQLKTLGVSWEADPRVVLGGCFIDTRDGTLDARLETQLAAFTQLLLQVRMQNRAAAKRETT